MQYIHFIVKNKIIIILKFYIIIKISIRIKPQIKQNIITRDDLQEKAGYYKIYNNTIEIDVTDCKSAKESAKKILSKIN